MAPQPPRPPNGVQFSHRRLKTSVQNPYETFTAPQFDTWVDDITSTIRNALSGKARGKARDPREGAGLDGLRRLFAQPGDPDESFAADETYDQSHDGQDELQHAPQESMDLTLDDDDSGQQQQQEEIDFFSENEEEAPDARDAEADRYYGRDPPVAADDDDQQETLDFDSIYANGASQYETRASPTWSIEAEGNITRQQDDGEYEEDYVEGEEYNEGDEYAEGEYYYEENQGAYAYYQDTQPAAPATREVLEIDDDDDEDGENQPVQPAVRSASVVNDEEEEVDELDDEDKENTDPARSPSVARSAAYARSPSHTRRTPLSSVRSGDASSPQPASYQATQPSPSPAPRPSQPEVFTISDDEDVDEAQPTPTPAAQLPLAITPVIPQDVAMVAPTDQIIDELDLDSLQQLPTQAVPALPEDGGMDLFDLADLETRAAGPSVADFLASAPSSQAAFDQDVAAYLETATPLDMSLVDPAILAAELAAFDAGIDAALQAQAQAAAEAVGSQAQAVALSEMERAATSDVASAVATAPEPGATGAEDGPLEGDGHDEGVEPDKSVGTSAAKEDAAEPPEAADVRSTTPPASPPRLHLPTTPSRERGEPLFMSPGELPVVPGEVMRDEPEKMSHPPTPHFRAPSPPVLGSPGHELPHFLDREDIEKDAPQEAGSPKPPGDDEVEKVHPDAVAEEPETLPDVPAETSPKVPEETLPMLPEEAAGVDEMMAHEMSVEEKKAFMQRDDIDPFSLMGDDSIIAPGAVDTPDEEEEVDELEEDAEPEADGVPETLDESDLMQGGQETDSQALPHIGDVDADASGESDGGHPEEVETGTAPQSTNVSTPVATVASPAQQHPEDVVQIESKPADPAPASSDVTGDVEPSVESAVDQEQQSSILPEAVSEPEQEETMESTQLAVESMPSAMEDILALPSPSEAHSVAASTPAADDVDATEATSSKGRKSARGRPLAATRSSARIARTQSSQQVPMAAPKARTRPPNSSKSEASVASASAGSSATGSALSRESSVGASSTRGRRRKREPESAHGSRESTVQPTARKIKAMPKGKGKGKAKQEVEEEEEVDELAKDEEPAAPAPTPAEPAPERPPLLRTQTYRHYHGKKNAAAGAMPTWASLKWNSILQPALALVRMGGGASSSTTETTQEHPAAESTSTEPPVEAPSTTTELPVPASSNGTSEVIQTDTKVEPSAEESSAPDTKLVPEVVVPHIADVAATSETPFADQGDTTKTEGKPAGLHLDALPPALPSPALASPAIPPPPVSTPAEAPRPRGHASRPSLVIQDSFMPESGHMTRSNCRFHKISIPAAPGSSEVVQFLTPACSITNRELMEDEGIIDCGVANDIDHARTVIELEVVSDEVLHVLRRLVGLEMLREGEVGFRIPDGETMESLRVRMPDSESSIFHQYRKPQIQSKDAEGSSNLSRKKRKRAASVAASVAASQASTLTDLEATDEEHDLADTPASRTRSRMGMSSSSPLSPVDRRKRRRVEHEDEYKPTDADHAIEAEDDEEDYAELAPKPKKRGRKSVAAMRSSTAPSPADTSATTPLPAGEGEDGGETGKGPGDEPAGTGAKPQKKAPRRKSRKRKAGVVDPAFKPSAAGASESESEGDEPARKPAKAKRGKKRTATEEGEQQEGTVEAGSARPPVSKKRKTAAAEPAGGETQN